MFNIFKKKANVSVNEKQDNNNINLTYKELRKELEEKFPSYNCSELFLDECFGFICRNTDNIKEALIVSAILRQIEPTINDIKLAYSLDEEYINNIINNKLPELKVLAYKRLEELPNEQVAFFPGFHNNFEPLYNELIYRIEYLFEVKRNTKKLLSEEKITNYVPEIINNSALLYLLNYLSIKDSLILASSLNIISIDEDIISNIYPFDEYYLREILEKNISLIKSDLSEKIQKLETIELEVSHLDYESLCYEYKDLYERIDDTLDYLKNKNKKI